MKSTFINTVRPGTVWTCHKDHHTLKFPEIISKGDVVIVLEVEIYYQAYPECHSVVLLSQKKGCTQFVALEDFYMWYKKI